jgi:hypothetical protein
MSESAQPPIHRINPQEAIMTTPQRRTLASLLLAPMFWLAGCSSVEPSRYANEKPTLDLFAYFSGTVDAWGYFSNRSGEVVKRFKVVIQGTVQNDTLTLDEDFSYADGSKSRRVWTIRRLDANRYSGRAGDVVGEATGVTHGNALRWTYVMALEVDGKTYNVDFDDWMYLQDDSVMLNKSVMSKFGLRLGEVILSFRKRS